MIIYYILISVSILICFIIKLYRKNEIIERNFLLLRKQLESEILKTTTK